MPQPSRLLTLVALGLLASPAQGVVDRWDFAIAEHQVRNGPAADGTTNSPATGWASFAYDSSNGELAYTIRWEGLQGDLTKLHIHGPAAPGENNPNHLIEIFNSVQDVLDAEVDPRDGSVTGAIVLNGAATECSELPASPTAAAASALPCFLEGLAYVNVHSQVFPMGEIRGNLVHQPEIITWAFDIDEGSVKNGNEIDGSTNSPATGSGSFRYETATEILDYTISWDGLEGDLTKLHVHGSADSDASNPNHLFEIFNTVQDVIDAGVDPRSDAFTGSIDLDSRATECTDEPGGSTVAAPGALPCFLEGRGYVNVHSTVDPMGEIRGNFEVQPTLIAWSAPADESQVRNGPESDGSTDSPATGTGDFRYDLDTGILSYRITWANLLGDLTKLHLHGPSGADESNPTHLVEIFNTVQEILDAGVDRRDGETTGQIALDLATTACTAQPATPTVAAPGALPCFLDELAYVNVHTTEHPTGEIRGNLRQVPHPYLWEFSIAEDQVKNGNEADGSTNSPAIGSGLFRYDAGTRNLSYRIDWSGLEGNLTKLHVHGPAGPEGSNPNHLFEIFNTVQEILDAGVDRMGDSVFGDIALDRAAAQCTEDPGSATVAAPGALPCFLQERGYVNVHSEVDPMGEIRGSLVLRLVPEPRAVLLQLAALASLLVLRARATRSARVAAPTAPMDPLEGSGTRRNVYS